MQPVADGFIDLIKMLIPAVILCTVVLGIAGSGSIKKAGRVGGKAIIYFEIVSTFALVIGLGMANSFGPGRSFHADPSKLDPKLVANYVTQAQHLTRRGSPAQDHPQDALQRLHRGRHPPGAADLGAPGLRPGAPARATTRQPFMSFMENVSKMLFGVMRLILYAAPLGAGAAIAFTIGKFGLKSLLPMG